MKKHLFSIRFLSCMLVSIMFIWVFTACGAAKEPASEGTTIQTTEKTDNTGQAATSKASEEVTGTVNIWTWETKEANQKMIDAFNKDNPKITVEFNNVAREDMAKKLQTALVAGSDMPDVAWMESTYRGKLISLDCWESLENYGVDKSNILDYMIPISTNEKGELIGIEVSPAFAGLAYKRDLAKEYFGTDDPIELSKLIPDVDTLIQKGIEIKQKSGGKVFMFSGVDTLSFLLLGQSPEPFVKDGNKLNVDAAVRPTFVKLIEATKAGIVDKLQQMTPAWNASYADKTHMFYPCATWSPTYLIKPNDKNGSGRWGLMTTPGGATTWGGTIVGIPKKSQNKQAAFEYINWNYLSEAGAKANRDNMEYFNTMKSTYKDAGFYTKSDPFFAGQDVFKTFAQEIAPKVAVGRPAQKYDQEINEAINIAIVTINSSKDGNISVDELIKKVESDILDKVPELSK